MDIVLLQLVYSWVYHHGQCFSTFIASSSSRIESRGLSFIVAILTFLRLASKMLVACEHESLVRDTLSLDTCCATCQIRCASGRCMRTCARIRIADVLTPYKLHNKYKIHRQYKYKACIYNSVFAWLSVFICSSQAGKWEHCPLHLYNKV